MRAAPPARVLSVQLEYSDAYARVMQAVRKAPQHTARGFRVAVRPCVMLHLGWRRACSC